MFLHAHRTRCQHVRLKETPTNHTSDTDGYIEFVEEIITVPDEDEEHEVEREDLQRYRLLSGYSPSLQQLDAIRRHLAWESVAEINSTHSLYWEDFSLGRVSLKYQLKKKTIAPNQQSVS